MRMFKLSQRLKILFFIIGCEFFINYKINFCKRTGKEEKLRV